MRCETVAASEPPRVALGFTRSCRLLRRKRLLRLREVQKVPEARDKLQPRVKRSATRGGEVARTFGGEGNRCQFVDRIRAERR